MVRIIGLSSRGARRLSQSDVQILLATGEEGHQLEGYITFVATGSRE
jgi:hypothetical protein